MDVLQLPISLSVQLMSFLLLRTQLMSDKTKCQKTVIVILDFSLLYCVYYHHSPHYMF